MSPPARHAPRTHLGPQLLSVGERVPHCVVTAPHGRVRYSRWISSRRTTFGLAGVVHGLESDAYVIVTATPTPGRCYSLRSTRWARERAVVAALPQAEAGARPNEEVPSLAYLCAAPPRLTEHQRLHPFVGNRAMFAFTDTWDVIPSRALSLSPHGASFWKLKLDTPRPLSRLPGATRHAQRGRDTTPGDRAEVHCGVRQGIVERAGDRHCAGWILVREEEGVGAGRRTLSMPLRVADDSGGIDDIEDPVIRALPRFYPHLPLRIHDTGGFRPQERHVLKLIITNGSVVPPRATLPVLTLLRKENRCRDHPAHIVSFAYTPFDCDVRTRRPQDRHAPLLIADKCEGPLAAPARFLALSRRSRTRVRPPRDHKKRRPRPSPARFLSLNWTCARTRKRPRVQQRRARSTRRFHQTHKAAMRHFLVVDMVLAGRSRSPSRPRASSPVEPPEGDAAVNISHGEPPDACVACEAGGDDAFVLLLDPRTSQQFLSGGTARGRHRRVHRAWRATVGGCVRLRTGSTPARCFRMRWLVAACEDRAHERAAGATLKQASWARRVLRSLRAHIRRAGRRRRTRLLALLLERALELGGPARASAGGRGGLVGGEPRVVLGVVACARVYAREAAPAVPCAAVRAPEGLLAQEVPLGPVLAGREHIRRG
ncbi:hypothetical protein DFH09DRAFT_1406225 [Mycena vulgaris]|nr:hypothetical protein DFH09DRAFT_1406225 [Mycena vulgaris]